MKVSIFIVGAAKSGTTSLHNYLNQHPNIVMSRQKESDYFSNKEILEQGLYYRKAKVHSLETYKRLFPSTENGKLYGESSVSYLFYPKVPARIKKYNPSSKIIIILRNPIKRAFSHYLMDFRLGLISESFESVFKKRSGLFFQQYFELGNYTQQVKRYFDCFKQKNVHIIWHDDFKKDIDLEMKKTYKFLGLDSFPNMDFRRAHNTFSLPKNEIIRKIYSVIWARRIFSFLLPRKLINSIKFFLFNKSHKPKLTDQLYHDIKSYYLQDICSLERLLSKNLDMWKK